MNEIIKIIMKPGTSKGDFLKFSSWLDSRGKLLSEEKTEDGRFAAVACFDNEIDFLAFLAVASWRRRGRMTRKNDEGNTVHST